MEAYTYSIYHIPSQKYYYGVRKSSTFDLGISYFSSSKLVKQLLKIDDLSLFIFKLRRKFNSYQEARIHETKFLQKVNAVNNLKFLNQAVSSPRLCNKNSLEEENRIKKFLIQ